jgi:hypothetical protein
MLKFKNVFRIKPYDKSLYNRMLAKSIDFQNKKAIIASSTTVIGKSIYSIALDIIGKLL